MEASSLATVVSSSGHSYAMAAAASTLSSAAMISEKYGGLTQVSYYECAHVHQCYKGFPLWISIATCIMTFFQLRI